MTWYEILAFPFPTSRNDDDAYEIKAAGNLHGAKSRVAEMRADHPTASFIIVRQHRKGGRFVVLHDLTVHNGMTAGERRAIACADAMAAAELRVARRS